MANTTRARYIPALSFRLLTRLYDPFVGLLLRDTAFKRQLVEQARIGPGQRVLDLGCGTATLSLLIKRRQPDAEVVGIDPDPAVLAIARAKAAGAGEAIALDEGSATALPYPDGSFDRVLSSLVFHHLTRADKFQAAREVARVLRPGGEFHVADFGWPHTRVMALIAQIIGRLEHAHDNVRGRLPEIFRRSGFEDVQITDRSSTLFGTLTFYAARVAAEDGR
jgi:ubiquinone/menaquinone biosynthesis C-methylase UbiE